jgi:hypothetical protein
VRWDKRGVIGDVKNLFRKKDAVVPISQLPSADQEAYFQKMIDAVVHHLVPALVTKLVGRLENGLTLSVGPCSLIQSGIAFRAGFIFHKDHLVPWHDAETQMQNGQVCLFNRKNPNVQVSMSARDTDNAVILPILCAAMRERTVSEQHDDGGHETEQRTAQRPVKKIAKGWLVFVGIAVVFGLMRACDTSNSPSSNNSFTPPPSASSVPAYAPPPAAVQPNYSTPSYPVAPNAESKTTYHVPSWATDELNRDSRAIDDAKAKAERMDTQLESLGREIEQAKLSLDNTSQFAIDQFNAKVDSYNALLEKARAQDRIVNQMVEDYNAKLRKYGQ